MAGMLKGEVEVDEKYVGARRPRHRGNNKRGRGTKKLPVMALVERDGHVYSKPIDRLDAQTLHGAIRETVDENSTIFTDEWQCYNGIGKHFSGGHPQDRRSA